MGGRWRLTALLLAAAAVLSWVGAAVLFSFVIPAMLADTWPQAAPERAAGATRVAALSLALIGIALLAGMLGVVSRHFNTAGRLVLVVAGIAAVVVGLLHATGGVAYLAHGASMRAPAITMLILSATSVAVGVFACAAGLSRLLPGQSLAERAIVHQPELPTIPARRRMLAPTIATAVTWAALVGVFLATLRPGVQDTAPATALFVGVVVVPPALAGALVGGWRQSAPNRLSTLGLAAAVGVAASWLFLVVLWLWEQARFPGYDLASGSLDLDLPIGFGIVGALLGATGYGLANALSHRLPRPHLHPASRPVRR